MLTFNDRSYWINLLSSYLPFFIQIFGALFFTPLFIKQLGQEQYGLFVLINTIIGYFSLCDIGFSQAFTYKVIDLLQKNEPRKVDALISSIFFYYLFVGVLINICVGWGVYYEFGAHFFQNETYVSFKFGLMTLSLSCLTLLVAQIFDRFLFALNLIYKINFIKSVQQLMIIISNILVLMIYRNINYVFLTYLVVNLGTCLILFAISKSEYPYRIRFSLISKEAFASVTKTSFWFFISIINTILIFQTDVFIITLLFDLKAVALYSVYYKFIQLFITMFTKPTESLIPNIARNYARQAFSEIRHNHRLMLVFTTLAAFAVSVVLFKPGHLFLLWWIGGDMIDDSTLLIPFLIYFILYSIDNVTFTFLSAMCLHKNSVIMNLLNGIANLFFSIYFAKLIGFSGIIWGSIAALVLTSFWYNLFVSRKIYPKIADPPLKDAV